MVPGGTRGNAPPTSGRRAFPIARLLGKAVQKPGDAGAFSGAGADASLEVWNAFQKPCVHGGTRIHVLVSIAPEHPFFRGEMLGAEARQIVEKRGDYVRAAVVEDGVLHSIHGGQEDIPHVWRIGWPGDLL